MLAGSILSKSPLFPDDLRQVSGGRCIVQCFGWTPWIAAVTLVIAGAAILIGNLPPTPVQWEVGGIPAALGILLLANELRRRLRRLSFVTLSDQIGIYRGHLLVAAAGRGDITSRGGQFELRKLWDNMSLMKVAAYSTVLGVAAAGGFWIFFSISVLDRLGPGETFDTLDRVLAGLMLIPCGAFIANLVLAAGFRTEIVVTARDTGQSFACLVASADAAELRP
jgi:hypothetical protein